MAEVLNIAYLAGGSFPVAGPLLSSAKDQYSLLVTETAGEFINMKMTTTSIIIQHSQACNYTRMGQLANALNALKTAQVYADQNLAACQKLLNMAEALCTTLMESSNALVITDVRLVAAENQLKELDAQLNAVNNEIALAEQGERNAIAQMQKADKPKFLRALLHKIIFRRPPAPGNPQIAAAHEADRKKYYELQLQQKQIQMKKIEEMRNVNLIVASLLGDFSNTQVGRAAITSALAGLDEVKTAIHYYQNFMREVNGNTAIAVQILTNLVELDIGIAEGRLYQPL